MQGNNDQGFSQGLRFNRRQVLTTAGLASLGLASVGTVSAQGGRTPLENEPVDILVYAGSGNTDDAFGFFEEPAHEDSGPVFAMHDPVDGGMFDFGKFELTPNSQTMHNTFELFHGLLIKSKPPSYPLVHQGEGQYESRGQVMNFETRDEDDIEAALSQGLEDEDNEEEPPFFGFLEDLAEQEFRAVGNDISQLKTDDGEPVPKGKWGVTRVDLFSQKGGPREFVISLLYVMWVNEDGDPAVEPTLGDAPGKAKDSAYTLIKQGVSNPGGQSR